MKKRRMAAAAAAFLLAALPLSVSAEEYTAGDGLQVAFTGSKLESSFDYHELAARARGMQPGDRMTMEVAVKNAGGERTDWYLSNEVLQTFEETDGTAAGGGAYTYMLSYTDGSGTKELYNSSRVGGEKNNASDSALGLHEAAESLEEYMYLGRLENGGEGKLCLTVVLDGETQGNDYAQTLASLKLNFAVEPVTGEAGSGGSSGGGGSRGNAGGEAENSSGEVIERTVKRYVTQDVKTGDYSRTLLWTAAALGSGLVLLCLAVAGLRRNRGGNGNEE